MTLCKVCHVDSKKHSKKMLELHQKKQSCAYCQKSGSEHSEKLWEMHKAAVDKGMHCSEHNKDEKLYPITLGFARTGVARVCSLNADPPYDKELVPIYMSCTECGLYLGSIEEDCADILDGMCLVCFREMTGQSGSWCDIPPSELASVDGKKIKKKKNRDHTKIDQKSTISTLSAVPERRRGRK